MNTSSKAFAVDVNDTTVQLRDLIVERLALKEHRCFFVFEKKDDMGMLLSVTHFRQWRHYDVCRF